LEPIHFSRAAWGQSTAQISGVASDVTTCSCFAWYLSCNAQI